MHNLLVFAAEVFAMGYFKPNAVDRPRTVTVLLLSLLLPWHLGAQTKFITFDHLSVEDGLSQSTVTAILQDRQGFVWIGTQDGLNRYDGNSFTVYRNEPSDSNSIADSYVNVLLEDKEGYLWVGMNGGGLDRFDPKSGTFTHFAHDLNAPDSEGTAGVYALAEDSSRNLWVGTIGNGLFRFPSSRSIPAHFRFGQSDSTTISNNTIWSLLVDRAGTVWVGTLDGLASFDAQKNSFVRYNIPRSTVAGTTKNITALAEDPSHRLWYCAWGAGIYSIDRKNDGRLVPVNHPEFNRLPSTKFRVMRFDAYGTLWLGSWANGLVQFDGTSLVQFRHDPDRSTSLSSDAIMSMCIDRTGKLWVGTDGGGLDRFGNAYRHFALYHHEGRNPNSITDDNVWAFCEDSGGNLWVGSNGGGLDLIDAKTGTVKHFGGEQTVGGLGSNKISAIVETADRSMWVGTQESGLYRLEPGKTTFRVYAYNSKDPASLGANFVNALYEDKDHVLWVGTYGGGLNKFIPSTGKFVRYRKDRNNPKAISEDVITAICGAQDGGLWVGTLNSGLEHFRSGESTHYRSDPQNPRSLNNDRILSVIEDSAKIVWIGTWGGGVNRLDPSTGIVTHLTRQEGLPNSTVYGILPDAKGRLWISTNKGLSCYDPERKVFRNFDRTDGLQHDEFNQGASLALRSGELLFGGLYGFNRFHPDSVGENPLPPPVAITAFTISGVPQKNFPSVHNEIRIQHDENFFTVQYAALDFTNPGKNTYAYMLEGLDANWVKAGNSRVATYTNVSPGTYIFHVVAANNDGVWNWDGVRLKIVVVPPPWRTWWAYGLYTITFVVGIMLTVRMNTKRQRRALAEQKLKIDEGERQLAKERFVSESLRRAEEQLSASLKEKEVLLREIHHRVKNNMQVVSSLLNLQSHQIQDPGIRSLFLESQDRVRSMALIHEKLYRSESLSRVDFPSYVRDLSSRLCRSYGERQVKLDIDAEDIVMPVDGAIPCGLILNELVTNALKYAFPADGNDEEPRTLKIGFHRDGESHFVLTVEDNGVGIPEHVDLVHPTTLGLQIVRTLSEQLLGKIDIFRSHGTHIQIRFPAQG